MYKWLSYPLAMDAPRPPAIPAPQLSEYMSIEADGANVQMLQFYNHTGTHLDTAAHVLKDGISINAFGPEDLIYRRIAVIELSLPDDTVVTRAHLAGYEDSLKSCDACMIKFDTGKARAFEKERFSKHMPGLSHDAAQFILESAPGLRMVGTDSPSIACINSLQETMTVHNYFFEHAPNEKFIIIEEMKLDTDLQKVKEIIVSPWLVEGMNSGPCVIWAMAD
jgi:arylformamidase